MEDLIRRLHFLPKDPEQVVPYLETLAGDARKLENPKPLFVHIFQFFERYPDADLGMPGPLVHYLENQFPAYIDQLIMSLQRHPTYHTVWMLNRLLNCGEEVPRLDELEIMLRRAANHPQADDLCRETASSFISLREG